MAASRPISVFCWIKFGKDLLSIGAHIALTHPPSSFRAELSLITIATPPATATPARQARGAKSFADFPTNETTLVQDLINLEDMGSSSRGKYAAGRSPARTYALYT